MNRPVLEPRLQCPLCRGRDCETAISFPDIPVLRCCACGLLFSGRVMPDKILAGYYTDNFAGPRHLSGQRLNAEMNFRVLQRILSVRKGISVLDAGCGYGFLLRLLRDKWRAEVTGIEISTPEVHHARDVLGLPLLYSSLTALPPDQRFDFVVSFEVIEHVRNPVAFVSALSQRVAPGGCLVVMTDNFDSPVARNMGCAFPKWIPHTHINHFTPDSLENCFARAGAGTVSFYSHTPWEMQALAAKVRLSKARPPSACFDLNAVLSTEMTRPFRLFTLRKLLNKLWIPLSLRANHNGSLLYAVVRFA